MIRRRTVTAANESAGHAAVSVLIRPPVRQSVLVRSDAERTFEVFVRTIGDWWPVDPFSAGRDQVREVTIERREGGRVYETWHDGTEVTWGELRAWEPSRRFVMTWTGTPAPTEVEFAFAVLGPALTRVTVEHRGWEALTDEQLSQDCALPGGYFAGAYSAGWQQILARFAAELDAAGPLTPAASDPEGHPDGQDGARER
jgi:hypothetical protein